ncbi:hypothetical protein [Actinoplanes ianthinogenes]|nr:hypothetical protein [Actinoplanes ianthinogenes]
MTSSPPPPERTEPAARPAKPRGRSGPPLPMHRAVLALGLLSAGPPLVIHDGWAGALPAAAAAGYAVYLVGGKRWPRPRRRRR